MSECADCPRPPPLQQQQVQVFHPELLQRTFHRVFKAVGREVVRHEFAGDEQVLPGAHARGHRARQRQPHLGLVAVHGRAVDVAIASLQRALHLSRENERSINQRVFVVFLCFATKKKKKKKKKQAVVVVLLFASYTRPFHPLNPPPPTCRGLRLVSGHLPRAQSDGRHACPASEGELRRRRRHCISALAFCGGWVPCVLLFLAYSTHLQTCPFRLFEIAIFSSWFGMHVECVRLNGLLHQARSKAKKKGFEG